MTSDEPRAPREVPLPIRPRIARLRRLVDSGDYFVSADVLARDLLRHLGLAPRVELPQQR